MLSNTHTSTHTQELNNVKSLYYLAKFAKFDDEDAAGGSEDVAGGNDNAAGSSKATDDGAHQRCCVQ